MNLLQGTGHRALFLDRYGSINVNSGYVNTMGLDYLSVRALKEAIHYLKGVDAVQVQR
jgi:hypothetical protein